MLGLLVERSAVAAHPKTTAFESNHCRSKFGSGLSDRYLTRKILIVVEPLTGAPQYLYSFYSFIFAQKTLAALTIKLRLRPLLQLQGFAAAGRICKSIVGEKLGFVVLTVLIEIASVR